MSVEAKIMPRRPAIRSVVKNIPLEKRLRDGDGSRMEIKFDITPDSVTISGLNSDHTQVKHAREYFDRQLEANPALMCAFLCEVVAHGLRSVPRREI